MMTEDQLLSHTSSMLRLAIASRLGIPASKYEGSLELQNLVNRQLTNVMSLGYNNCDIAAVLVELCQARHYGEEDSPAVIAEVKAEITATVQTLGAEVAAFSLMNKLRQDGAQPERIWALLLELLEIDRDFRSSIPQVNCSGTCG